MPLSFSREEVESSGGLIPFLTKASSDYIRSISGLGQMPSVISTLRRHIVHTDPHLDEYFAELLFRAFSPVPSTDIEFVEQSIYSEDNDFGSQKIWPKAVVFGIGSTVSCGVAPGLLFDEHLAKKGKSALSCSDVVSKYLGSYCHVQLPPSVKEVLQEVNAIDAFGYADPQHLANGIKLLHNVRFLLKKGATPVDDIRDQLDPYWKRAVVDACIVSIVYARQNGMDLCANPDEKKKVLVDSLHYYAGRSAHKTHPHFNDALQTISSNSGNQAAAFKRAVLKRSGGGEILDSTGHPIPQLMLMSRLCYSLHQCWGTDLTRLLMLHLWEVEFQKQLNFTDVMSTLRSMFAGTQLVDARTPIGLIRCESVGAVESMRQVKDKTGKMHSQKTKGPLWLINISPNAKIFSPHQAATNYINTTNRECGIVLVEDSFLGTKALFRCDGVSPDKWRTFVQKLQSVEPECWYDASADPSNPAPFIINGNKAHQYVPRSSLDFEALKQLALDTVCE